MPASKALANIKPYGPPFWEERAWDPTGRDDWILHAMRAGLVDALVASIKMDEQNPESCRPVGVEAVRFRSNRLPIDGDIVSSVMDMDDQDVEKAARWRRDNADQLNGYPRACLDAFASDIPPDEWPIAEWVEEKPKPTRRRTRKAAGS